MKTTFVSLVIASMVLALALSAGFASAAFEIKGIALPTTTNHGQDITIHFNLSNTDTTAHNGVIFTESTTNIGTWKTLPPATSVPAGQSKELTAVLSVPLQASGTISAQLKGKDDESVQATAQTITITINETPSLSITKLKEVTLSQNGTINITNNGNVQLNNVEISSSGNANIALVPPSPFSLAAGASKAIEVNVLGFTNPTFGDNTITITARDTQKTQATNVTTFALRKSFCNSGAKGKNLTITDVDIKSNGDDDDEWKLIVDEVTIEVEVENNGQRDIDSTIKLGLFDNTGKNVIGKLDFLNKEEEEIDVDIDEDDSETVTFKFRVSGDMKDGTYRLAIKAFEEGSENALCTDTSSDLDNTTFEIVKVVREEDEDKRIAFESVVSSPEATCGDSLTLNARMVNIGDEDEDRVKVTLKNADLKIDASQEFRNLDKGDDESFTFNFIVPRGVTDKIYMLDLSAEYDYRSAGYHEVLATPYRVPLKVFGCTPAPSPSQQPSTVSVTAALDSEAKPGANMLVKTMLKNTGSQQATVLVNVKGYDSWAKLSEISQRIVTLAPNESKNITLTFEVKKEASGEQSFTLDVTANDKTQTQQVSVSLPAKQDSLLGSFGDNKLAWIIGIINFLLIIIIIIVAIKISQR